MKISNEEQKRSAEFFVKEIRRLTNRPLRLMEVCGTHTVAIFKSGIRQLLPCEVELISGPGCPVCVTPNDYLDMAIAYSRQKDTIITTFGDMLKVPGSTSSLAAEKAEGRDIRVVYSPLESLDIAAGNLDKKVIFLAVGFETTAPTAAATVLEAERKMLRNFYVLSAHKRVPPALNALCAADDITLDGLLLPGHVSAIIGEQAYAFLSERFSVPAVIAGFEALDILQAVYFLVKQIREGKAAVENQYRRIVKPEGNVAARNILSQVYEEDDAVWRGIGLINFSGLKVNAKYRRFDAEESIPVEVEPTVEPRGCRCGEVLRGVAKPFECSLFGDICRPEQPVGSCMVSVEGACAAWYRYGTGRWQI
ncbi:MAG: hydrogenase expression/formation protein HypD [Firmicutes bacterium]|nr:hydrogenase expression/formation protein HypD [Bacillota bacterium]